MKTNLSVEEFAEYFMRDEGRGYFFTYSSN